MKKRTWLISIALLIVLFAGAGIGVKIHMDTETQKREIKTAEKAISQDVVKNYLGIRKIDFTSVEYTSDTGAYDISFKVNDDSTEFFYTYFNRHDYDGSGSDEADISKVFKHRANGTNYREDYSKVKVIYQDKLKE